MRKSKNHTFCFFTQFGNALPYGKGEFAPVYNMCALKNGAKRGKPFGFPIKSRKNYLSAQIIFRELIKEGVYVISSLIPYIPPDDAVGDCQAGTYR